jgi:hypothetical protein
VAGFGATSSYANCLRGIRGILPRGLRGGGSPKRITFNKGSKISAWKTLL